MLFKLSILKFVILPISLTTDPENSLLSRRNTIRFFIKESSVGSEPVNELSCSCKTDKVDNLPNSLGNDPDRRLPARFSSLRLVIKDSSLGIKPVNELVWK